MYSILVVSDSHGLTNELITIKERHDVDLILHVGDSELDEDSSYLAAYESVLGNCDWQANFPKQITKDIGGLRLFMTHGHLYGVKGSLMKLQYAAMEKDAQIVIYGHSHIPKCEELDGRIFVNPGSIRLPRNYPLGSYLVMSWDEQKTIQINYYDLDGNLLEDLSKNIPL